MRNRKKTGRAASAVFALVLVFCATGCTMQRWKFAMNEHFGVGCPSCGSPSNMGCACFTDRECGGYQSTTWRELSNHCGPEPAEPAPVAPSETEFPTPADEAEPTPDGRGPHMPSGPPTVDPAPELPGTLPGGERPRPEDGAPSPRPGQVPPDLFPEQPVPNPFPEQMLPGTVPGQPLPTPETETPESGTTPNLFPDLFPERSDPAPAPQSGDEKIPEGLFPEKSDPAPMPPETKGSPSPPPADDLFPETPETSRPKTDDPAPMPPGKSSDGNQLPDLFPEEGDDQPADSAGDADGGTDATGPNSEKIPDDLFPPQSQLRFVPKPGVAAEVSFVRFGRVLNPATESPEKQLQPAVSQSPAAEAFEPRRLQTEESAIRMTAAVEPANRKTTEGSILRLVPFIHADSAASPPESADRAPN